MFVIDKEKNRIIKIKSQTFSELGFRERDHLQEWLENILKKNYSSIEFYFQKYTV